MTATKVVEDNVHLCLSLEGYFALFQASTSV